ncbi:acid phosphatase domain-containing protein [Pseudomonas phage EM]|uniref:Acid phosphatase domain-containing protein n=1 Tax=Pseudomonas phage EM TaxID=2936914 RepID=A0AAE9HI93_9CAUD|nr:acid phosphatase domain-containing protein [Pseudomonas phage EM]UPW35908.1 acid phosphatase domain-containing protein [Pseudomonas phage EM]
MLGFGNHLGERTPAGALMEALAGFMGDPYVIAFDYDETISLSPETFRLAMDTFRYGGFEVIVVTARCPSRGEELHWLTDHGFPVYFTDKKAKRPFMEELGIKVAVWVDDNPFNVDNDLAPWTVEQYEAYMEAKKQRAINQRRKANEV